MKRNAIMTACAVLLFVGLAIAEHNSGKSMPSQQELHMAFPEADYFTDMLFRIGSEQMKGIYKFCGETPPEVPKATRHHNVGTSHIEWTVEIPEEMGIKIGWKQGQGRKGQRIGAVIFLDRKLVDSSELKIGVSIAMDTSIVHVTAWGNKKAAAISSMEFLNQYCGKKIAQLGNIQSPKGQDRNAEIVTRTVKHAIGVFSEALKVRMDRRVSNISEENFLQPR